MLRVRLAVRVITDFTEVPEVKRSGNILESVNWRSLKCQRGNRVIRGWLCEGMVALGLGDQTRDEDYRALTKFSVKSAAAIRPRAMHDSGLCHTWCAVSQHCRGECWSFERICSRF